MKRKTSTSPSSSAFRSSVPSSPRPRAAPSALSNDRTQNNLHNRFKKQRMALPIWEARHSLVKEISDNGTVVVVGETGSGKTTQLPQYLREANFTKKGKIAITQPRRVAAMTVARRVAKEIGVELGQEVGYCIRFDDKTSAKTELKYMTDGMLLREAMIDPLLSQYSVIVLDEAHERTLHTDVLFALVKGIQKKRKELKVIIMSATLQAEKFAAYFSAKVLYVAGRQFPVDIYYLEQRESDYMDAALITLLQIHLEKPSGDILLFLTGQEEIEHMEKLLLQKTKSFPPEAQKMLVCPIFAALPPDRQMKAFSKAPENTRKVILATNIAETSITISGVIYVVDTGYVKERLYNPKLGIESLTVVPISKAAARQRAGRAGRECHGECYRLYKEEAFEALPDSSTPEILRCNMSSVVLQLKALGVGDVLSFDYMDKPPLTSVKRSVELLRVLGALDSKGHLTSLGTKIATLPLDPMLAKTLLISEEFGCSSEVLSIVSLLSSESIFFYPKGGREKAEAIRKRFFSMEGDHLTLLNVYKAYAALTGQRHQWCRDNFINFRSIKHATEVRKQLEGYCLQLGIQLVSCGDETECIRKSITSGFFLHAAIRQEDGEYKTCVGNKIVHLHPSSVLFGKKPGCVIYNQLVFTKRNYMRDVVMVQPQWLTELSNSFYGVRRK